LLPSIIVSSKSGARSPTFTAAGAAAVAISIANAIIQRETVIAPVFP